MRPKHVAKNHEVVAPNIVSFINVVYDVKIHNINETHNIKCYNLMVLGYMFRPHCGHLQANSYRLSALNVRTLWDPILYAH
jgi:hypothetical protein